MRATSSLTNRVFLACTLLATLSLGLAFYFVDERATSEAEADLRRGLLEAATLVERSGVIRTDHFIRLARVVADLPKLKAAVETGDPPTVQPIAEEYREEVAADLLVLTGRTGMVLGADGGDSSTIATAARPQADDEVTVFVPHERGVLQLVSVPILLDGDVPEILGHLTIGLFLDQALAAELKSLTGGEVAFGVQGRILASTLPAQAHATLTTVMNRPQIGSITIGNEEFLALSKPMEVADSNGGVAIILRSRTDSLRFLSTIRIRLAAVMVVTLLLATILSYGVARTMTRPLAAITTAMREVAATGDLTRKISLKSRAWDDEDARLLASTFNTLTESVARSQREAAQRERLSSLGRLSTVIAHEIRNPLMIIRASLSTLRNERVTAVERREAISDIDDETIRLNRIVSEVLDFARPIRFELAETNINDVCRASAAAAWTGSSDSSVSLDLDAHMPLVATDAERLRTALVNILTNARHAVLAVPRADTGTDGPSVSAGHSQDVLLRTRAGGGRVRIAIRDYGVGISPEDLTHIFDPYFTTRRAGTGLGLPIAKNIIEGLGGVLTVSSRRGEGTEVQIDLPLSHEVTRA
jgi:signal transduction histidine kinase